MENTQVAGFRREVLKRIAKYVWEDSLTNRVYDILQIVKDDSPRVRCCVHKERAVIRNRIQMALWQKTGLHIVDAAEKAMTGEIDKTLPVMDVLPDACDACPIDKYYVTDLCRHCIQHKCMEHCPKKAISIQNGRATIDRDVCIECGRCAKSCPYGAIIEITRPCIKACALDALSSGPDKRTVIDYDKCVTCGNCREACPFGALDERSMIAQILLAIKRGRKVTAMIAPSIVGQFGPKIHLGQIIEGLKRIGFSQVAEVAVGADITTLNEAAEFKEKVPEKIEFMTSSCCPAFVEHVKKHFPEYENHISQTTSPMVSCGRWIKGEDPETLTCFIGPCIAKKMEVIHHPECMDFAMTYEELSCIFEGLDIDLAKIEAAPYQTTATAGGIGFPLNRGVQSSVKAILDKEGHGDVIMEYADGLRNCQEKLTRVKQGTLPIDYFEGMACLNGCVDGPGTLAQQGLTRVMVTKFAQAAPAKVSDENAAARRAMKELNFEV